MPFNVIKLLLLGEWLKQLKRTQQGPLWGEAHFFWPKWILLFVAEQGMCMCRLMVSGLHNYVVPAFFF